MQNWYHEFYPSRPDLVAAMQSMAAQLQGHLEKPRLRWKYIWMKPVLGWKTARRAQWAIPYLKQSCMRNFDKFMHLLEAHGASLVVKPSKNSSQKADPLESLGENSEFEDTEGFQDSLSPSDDRSTTVRRGPP